MRGHLEQLAARVAERRRRRRLADAALREREVLYRAIVEQATAAVFIIQDGRYRYVNPRFCETLGYTPEEIYALDDAIALVHPEDRPRVADRMRRRMAGENMPPGQFRIRHRTGVWIEVEVYSRAVELERGAALVGFQVDVTERVQAELELRVSEARFRALVEQSPEAIVLHAEGRIQYMNAAGAALLGVPDGKSVEGSPILDFIHPDSREAAREQFDPRRRRGPAIPATVTCRLLRADDGRVLDVEVTSVRGTFAGRRVVQSHLHDVTEQRALEALLTHQAFHDPLTGLANRMLFLDRVEHTLPRLNRGEHMAVVLLDLDDFKTVNDSLGHAAGDELLAVVAERLLHAARGSDTVARFGGDEFALVLEGLSHDEDAEVVLGRVRDALCQPAAIGGREVPISASFGVAIGHGRESADELVRNADAAMYRAKAEGKGRVALFAPEMHAEALARLELEADLRAALDRGEFRLLFQPLVELASGRVVGAEALLRWEHPARGTVPPAIFIPVAEQTGFIVPLGRWVLAEACRQARAWDGFVAGRGAEALHVAVNISGRQLQEPAFAVEVAAVLAESSLEPRRLVLEITESVMLHDADAALVKLGEIRALGARLAIDDFGTGYSSLAYLQRFPINLLKLDKSFTDGLGSSAAEPALFRAIMQLGRSLGMHTVAEGIETELQVRRLRELGCELGQGFLLAAPLAPAAFLALLRERRH